jgi:hypothetical protein
LRTIIFGTGNRRGMMDGIELGEMKAYFNNEENH